MLCNWFLIFHAGEGKQSAVDQSLPPLIDIASSSFPMLTDDYFLGSIKFLLNGGIHFLVLEIYSGCHFQECLFCVWFQLKMAVLSECG